MNLRIVIYWGTLLYSCLAVRQVAFHAPTEPPPPLILPDLSGSPLVQRPPSLYQDYALIQVTGELDQRFMDFVYEHDMDVWSIRPESVELLVNFDDADFLTHTFSELSFEVLNQNIQQEIDKETDRLNSNIEKENQVLLTLGPQEALKNRYQGWFEEYHRYEDIIEWYHYLEQQFPSLVRINDSIGITHEGRNIMAVTITGNKTTPSYGHKKRIWFQGLQHAREWVGGTTVQYTSFELLKHYLSDPEITLLMDNLVFIFIPVMNPDGYDYSWTSDRLWRKNRRPLSFGMFGVDINRNWDDHWGEGRDGHPWSEIYAGPHAESEPEVQAAVAHYLSLNVSGAVDLHCYSQLILRPYGWTSKKAPHEFLMKELGDQMQMALFKVHGKKYNSITITQLYKAPGSSIDWWYEGALKRGAKRAFSFGMEMRPKGNHGGSGFILPATEIKPTGEEGFAALATFAGFVLNHELPEKA